MSCNACKVSLQNKPKIECDECKSFFHLECVNLTPADLKYFEDESQLWRCEPCGKVRRKSMILESTSAVTFEDVLKVVNGIKEEFKSVEKSLGASLEFCHEQLAEALGKLDSQKQDISNLTTKLDEVKMENNSLRQKVSTLESRIDGMEQYSRKNCVEIHGIPTQPNENVIEVVKKVGAALNFPINDMMVDACHRLHSREQLERPPGIIVKMVRRLDVEGLLAKRRVKRNLNTTDIGLNLPLAKVVYINESLSPARRNLFNLARAAKRDKGYTFLWVRSGKIFMRKADKMPVKVIATPADLEKLLAKNMKLKTKSHGKNENRQLVVYKILTLNDILHNLLRCGGENEKYLVLSPQGDDSSNAEALNNNEELKKENASVSVRVTVPADCAEDKTTLPTPRNLSQIIEESVEKSSVLKTGSVYEDSISVKAPEMVVLSSDDDADPKHDQDDTKHKPLSSEALQLAKTLNVEESDIDVINRVINMKKDDIQQAIETYNYYVRRIHGGEQLKKPDKKKYNACRKQILDLGGINRPEINKVKRFSLEALLVHVDSITNTSSIEESSDKPSNSQGCKKYTKKALVEKKAVKIKNRFNCETKGLQILNQNPELIPEHLKIVVRALKEAERIRSDVIRHLRRRLKKCVEVIGAGKDLERDIMQDIQDMQDIKGYIAG